MASLSVNYCRNMSGSLTKSFQMMKSKMPRYFRNCIRIFGGINEGCNDSTYEICCSEMVGKTVKDKKEGD